MRLSRSTRNGKEPVAYVRTASQAVLAASQYAHVELGKRHWVERCRKSLETLLRISGERDNASGDA
jgi:hypothetical protein